jgi:BirA family biotin operon repressor/biotin-[acetyl-CoA-carboxylase] ligase
MTLRDTILYELLLHPDDYISGAGLAERLDVSRNAVWKTIEQLKSEGVQISSVPNRGYKLTEAPDVFCAPYMETLLKGCTTPWNVQWLPETGSTNDVAKSLAAQGAAEGTVIIADRQTGGKGRMGKSFHSPKGSLYMSLILRPTLPLSDMMAVTACTAAAVHKALSRYNITAKIKWVNDLFLNGRKICGILSEGSFNAELLTMDHLVIGIGINLQPDPTLPDELRPIVTDLLTETRQKIPRFALAADILRELEDLMAHIQERTFLPIYKDHSMTIGRRVQVQGAGGMFTGTAIGYASDAGLIVAHDDGTQETIRTGTAVFVD